MVEMGVMCVVVWDVKMEGVAQRVGAMLRDVWERTAFEFGLIEICDEHRIFSTDRFELIKKTNEHGFGDISIDFVCHCGLVFEYIVGYGV